MMRSLRFKKFWCILIVLAIVLSQASLFGAAFAASDNVNIFRDTFEEEEIDDFNWTLSKPETTAIARKDIDTEGVFFNNNTAGWEVIRYGETVTLEKDESLEIEFTINSIAGTYIMPSFNAASDYDLDTIVTPHEPFGSIHVFPAGGAWVGNNYSNTPDAEFVVCPAGSNVPVVNGVPAEGATRPNTVINQTLKYEEGNWVASTTTLGEGGWTWPRPIDFKAVYHADGSIFYHIRQNGDTDWATLCYVKAGIPVKEAGDLDTIITDGTEADYTTTAFPDLVGKEAYPAIAVTNAAGAAEYSNISDISVSKISAAGTPTLISENYGEWAPYTNTANPNAPEFSFVQSAMIVENAANDDYVYKKTALSAPKNELNPYLYDIELDILADNLTADGEGIIYIGATDTNLTGAAEIYFRRDGTTGKTMMGVRNGEEEIPEVECAFNTVISEFRNLRIRQLNSGKNELYLDGERVAEFTKVLKNTYLAFGTKAGTGTAKFAVKSANINRYDYLQGTGGDFVEDFEDNKYNYDNLLIQVHPDYADPDKVQIKDGQLVLNDAYGVTVSTMELYGDFEFSFKITSIGDLETSSVFGVAFGKPVAESGESLSWLQFQQYGGVVIPEGDHKYLSYAEGYSSWSTPADGLNVYTHDYSQSAIVVKFVKRDINMELYIYREDQPESTNATKPFQVYTSCFGYGAFDFRSLPTGVNLTITLDDITVKNLDETKGDLNVADPNSRQELVLDVPLDPEPTDPEPTDPKDPEDKGGCGGCNQSQASAVLIMIGSLSVAFLMKRR